MDEWEIRRRVRDELPNAIQEVLAAEERRKRQAERDAQKMYGPSSAWDIVTGYGGCALLVIIVAVVLFFGYRFVTMELM
ncbi:hypothetical protein ACIBCM_29980 [Streptomyces sp. NPDC051018]|uniref:hypothetical protein n=1 Tax=Streptomyces sp. NPDC051018 TaxID=3365639 RepID=UPI003798815D